MKRLFGILFISLLTVSLVAPATAYARADDDYKVIKNAKKQKKSDKEPSWFKILVTDTETGKDKVRITLPLSLVEVAADWCPDGKFKVDNDINIDIQKFIKELKKVGPLALIEVYEDDETVKIWIE